MPYYYDKALNRYKATNVVNQSQWFDSWEDAEAFSKSGGPITEYRGFNITPLFQISKNGKFVFTAWHQRCHTLEQAMLQIDMSIIAGEIMGKYPNLAKVDLSEILENDSYDYSVKQVDNHFDNELWDIN